MSEEYYVKVHEKLNVYARNELLAYYNLPHIGINIPKLHKVVPPIAMIDYPMPDGVVLKIPSDVEYDGPVKLFLEKYDMDMYQLKRINPTQILNMVYTIAKLHSYGMIHRDVKCSNFLVRGNEVALCDFDTIVVHDPKDPYVDVATTITTRAPETDTTNYDFKIDVWALGIILMQFACERYNAPRIFNESKYSYITELEQLFLGIYTPRSEAAKFTRLQYLRAYENLRALTTDEILHKHIIPRLLVKGEIVIANIDGVEDCTMEFLEIVAGALTPDPDARISSAEMYTRLCHMFGVTACPGLR